MHACMCPRACHVDSWPPLSSALGGSQWRRWSRAPPLLSVGMDSSIQDELLTLSRPRDIGKLIEATCDKMGLATGCIAVHVLAQCASQSMSVEEKQQLASEAWFGRLLMRLGGQLAGASETDAHGLTTILWALALLEQTDSPLLQGLVKRLLLLAQHGRVSASQMLLTAQALARLKLLHSQIGQAFANLTLSRVAEFNAAQLGTIARCVADGLKGNAEPLVRAIVQGRLGEFSTEGVAARIASDPANGLCLSVGVVERRDKKENVVRRMREHRAQPQNDLSRRARKHLGDLLLRSYVS